MYNVEIFIISSYRMLNNRVITAVINQEDKANSSLWCLKFHTAIFSQMK